MILDCIVIGGGPAGLMACNQLEGHKNYILLEKNDKVGKKLLLTGGKRCNITNNLPVRDFIESLHMPHKRFLYPSLTQFGPKDVIQFFDLRGLELDLEQNFKYFPKTGKSQSVLDALLKGIKTERIHYKEPAKKISKQQDLYLVETDLDTYLSKNVIIAVGSNAYPTMGSSGDALVFAKYLEIPYKPYTPAETYLFSDKVKQQDLDLQGVAITTKIRINQDKKTHDGDILFTHFGVSGPIILHISELIYDRLLKEKVTLYITLTEVEPIPVFNQARTTKDTILTTLETMTSKRLAKKVLDVSGIENKRVSDMKKTEIERLNQLLTAFPIPIDGVEVKEKAFVNAGGIDVKAMNPQTMETIQSPGLYFIGESTDLQGPIGGFNITIALSTGRLAAKHIVSKG
jgi:predicted Rossmann fold flavoprotein